MISGVFSYLQKDSRVSRLLRAISCSARLTIYLERPEPGLIQTQRSCAAGSRAGCQRRASCRETRLAVFKSAIRKARVSGLKCPVGGFCLAAPVYANGILVAVIRAGGFAHPREAQSARYPAVRSLLALAAREIGGWAGSLLAMAKNGNRPIDRAYDFLFAHALERITIAQVASHAGISRQNLSRAWHRSFDQTIADSLALLRVQRACHLLEHRESKWKKIIDVAFESGFGSVSQFNRTFRKITGISPHEYARQKYPV